MAAGGGVPVRLFCSDICKEISVVAFSAIAGWEEQALWLMGLPRARSM